MKTPLSVAFPRVYGPWFLLATTSLLLACPLRTSGIMLTDSGTIEAVGE